MSEQVTRQAGIPESVIQSFASVLEGEVIRPHHPAYEQARSVWNGMINRRPQMIVRCKRTADVIACVNFARSHQLEVAVRGGAHNVAGHATCHDGLVIDLSPMKEIAVDPAMRVALAEGGVTWGELDAATQVYGLATPGGVFSSTGIAGLTLGGGYGYLRNKFGLACDNLIGAEVVTADGELIQVSETVNRDLLWALRGGGGNFGVVTQFKYRLHPLGPEVMFVYVFHDGRGGGMKHSLQVFRDFCATAPDEVSLLGAAGVIPPGTPHIAAEIHGLPFFAMIGLYAGPAGEGQRVLQPLRDFAQPLADLSGVMPYVQAQKAFDEDYPDGLRYYWKSINVPELDDEIIDRIVVQARRQPSPLSTIDIWHMGGAVQRAATGDSAFYGRQANFLVNAEANWEHYPDDEANIAWARQLVRELQPFSDGSRYLNFAGFQEEGDEMMRRAYGPQYQRLLDLKKRYDPNNFFRLNQNIRPV